MLRTRLTRAFRGFLEPVKVMSLVITKADRHADRSVLVTVCPIERRESGWDFEVGLERDRGSSIGYVIVDGRRLFPRRTRKEASKRGSGP